MRVVIDTNVLISALLVETSLPAHLIALWREGRFDLLTSAEQLDELRRGARISKKGSQSSRPICCGRVQPDECAPCWFGPNKFLAVFDGHDRSRRME